MSQRVERQRQRDKETQRPAGRGQEMGLDARPTRNMSHLSSGKDRIGGTNYHLFWGVFCTFPTLL